ncbi:hypothetical protein MKW98_009215 [Papaver atlanticum]|uniref:Uncharacterized protein n=1 Tax=Papaver atlanticum TaxID=357466 RepID=A0AAD4SW87_9MAGN|nr:hypothetical protein MKW98_009215 [Papaver atlanticum]
MNPLQPETRKTNRSLAQQARRRREALEKERQKTELGKAAIQPGTETPREMNCRKRKGKNIEPHSESRRAIINKPRARKTVNRSSAASNKRDGNSDVTNSSAGNADADLSDGPLYEM